MTSYVICDFRLAMLHCNGLRYRPAWESVNDGKLDCAYGFRGDHLALVYGVDINTQLVLSLADPMFRKVTEGDMSAFLRSNLNNNACLGVVK